MSNVVPIGQAKEPKPDGEEKSKQDLEEIAAKNAKNAERVAKERANANKSVLRSYRIKH